MRHTESYLGRSLTDAFKLKYPKHHRSWIHIPNGVVLSGDKVARARQMARLKREGLQVGASDYFIAVPNKIFPGMFLEIKEGKNKLTPDQASFLVEMIRQGYFAVCTTGFDESWAAITKYMEQK